MRPQFYWLSTLAWIFLLTIAPVRAANSRGVRSVNFRNFTYQFSWLEEKKITLRRGTAPKTELHDETELVSVQYHDFDRDGSDEAIVVLGTNCYASCWYIENYYVFAYRQGRVQQIFHEVREQPYGLIVRGQALVIAAPTWFYGEVHCCPQHKQIDKYQWRRNHFVLASRRRMIDRDGSYKITLHPEQLSK